MLSDEQRAVLADELRQAAYSGLSADAAFALLNEPRRVETPREVPARLTLESVLAILSAGTALKLATNPNLTDIRDKMVAADSDGMRLWVGLLARAGILQADEISSLQAAMAATSSVVDVEEFPPRIARKFRLGEAVVSMPNIIDREEFDAAWSAR